MRTINGFPYVAVQFTKDGAVHDRHEVADLRQMVSTAGITDLFVLSHGWNNNMAEAEALYTDLLRSLRTMLSDGRVGGLGDRKFGVLGLLWPSKRFAPSELTASGAAGIASAVDAAVLAGQLDQLAELIDDPPATAAIDKARTLIPRLEDQRTARREFAELLRSAVGEGAMEDEDASSDVFQLPGDEVMDRLARPVFAAAGPVGGQAASTGGAAAGGLGRLFAGGPLGAGRNLANFLTYYKMKERAGVVGARGGREVLTAVGNDLRLHLVGHSFGARLVTAAVAAASNQPPSRVTTLSLLQAAFSHYSFAERYEGTQNGGFLRVVKENLVKGPVLITHTKNDVAVGVAYPLASMLRRQVASGLGDKNDRFGGLGRNGAQKTANTRDGDLLAVGGDYPWAAARVHNLLADDFIADHGAVAGEQVAYAVLTAVAAATAD